MLGKVKALLVKEILAVWQDKRSRIALIAPPLIQLFVLANAATLEVKNITIGLFNQDSGWYSHELTERIKGSPYFTNVRLFEKHEDIKVAIDHQDIILAMQIQQDFSRQLDAGNTATVEIILDGRKSNASQIVNGYVSQIIQNFNEDILKVQGIIINPPIAVVFRSWFNPNLEYIVYNIPCLVAILSMIITLMVTSLSIAREREMGTFDQLLVSPLEPWQILIGKALPAMIIGIAESSLIMVIAMFAFNVTFQGAALLLYFSMIVFVSSIVGIGLFISSLVNTQQQATLGIFVFMVPTILLSGYATPIENMPQWLQYVTAISPIKYFLIIVKGVFLKDMGVMDVLSYTWPIALIACITLPMANWMFRRHME